ncbi:NAD(P)H-quinone oxidoreductase [Hymenobacter sp. GOD-10R]|uniref:NAD(P)H-quinone oxidoreductase n=1 Tax=Hymenobacter sp. GOD-10R TaxID=3093922 RepID=UPI002D782D19|nr:NAD(P)H-quinone oxidoreductase [Hymenobacter sp. GOD-10R]WRQ30967.1 NAD(P)H-quinone oxidoreductase [Hymenobacter sp. GOD-10R]
MKVIVVTEPGGPEVLRVQEKPIPSPAANQVLVRVHAAGVNRPDVFLRKGKYGGAPTQPGMVLGLEIAGEVVEVGAEVTRWQPNDAVCALVAEGGYAEYAVVDARHCLPVPAGWSFEEAASLPETVFTVWHNVFQKGQLTSGENFLVHGGSSGIGITAIQLAVALGAKVFSTAGGDEKCRACEELGATRCINYKTQDFEAELKGEGVDVILDMIGGDYIAKNIRLLRPDGRLEFINAMQGPTADINVLDIMARRLTISGSTLRPRSADFKAELAADIEKQVWPLLAAGKFKPMIYKVFPLSEAAEAHHLMESSAHIGKIMLRIE